MAWEFEELDTDTGDRLNPKDCLGHLLIIWAVNYIEDSPTKFSVQGKQSDVIVVDVVDLDVADEFGYQGKVYRKCWWRQARLISTLKSRIGRGPALAWMDKGVATMGFPPFILTEAKHDPQANKRAQAWFQAHPDFTPGSVTVVARHVPDPDPQVQVQPEPRQESMLERMARQQADALRANRAGSTTSSLPLPPPSPPAQDPEPPF